MGLFGKKPKKMGRPRGSTATPEQRQERLEKRQAWDVFVKQMKDNPELEKEFVFKKLGFESKPKDPAEQKRQELKATLTDEAIKLIGEDEELRRGYAESMISEVIGKSKSRRNSKGEEFYTEMPGSSITQALEELESLSELRGKLEELGMGSGNNKGGFFKGLTMKDILDAFHSIQGNQNLQLESGPVYIVQVDGKPTKVTEDQYNHLLKEGRIKPIAQLGPPQEKPKEKPKEEGEDAGIQPIISSQEKPNLPPLDVLLEQMDIETLNEYVGGNPADFVNLLKEGVLEEDDGSKFLWGFLSNTTYEGVMDLVTPYREDSRATELVDKLASDEGREWLESVISMIQEVEQNA